MSFWISSFNFTKVYPRFLTARQFTLPVELIKPEEQATRPECFIVIIFDKIESSVLFQGETSIQYRPSRFFKSLTLVVDCLPDGQ